MEKMRLFANVLVMAMLVQLIGCTKTEDEKPQPPAPELESTAPTEHEIIVIVREFLKAIDDGDYEHAIGMGTPNEFKREGLIKVNEAFDFANIDITEAFVGDKNAAVLIDSIPGPSSTVQFGYSLVKSGNQWLVRDVDMLPDNESVKKWLAGFKGVEPTAKRVAGTD